MNRQRNKSRGSESWLLPIVISQFAFLPLAFVVLGFLNIGWSGSDLATGFDVIVGSLVVLLIAMLFIETVCRCHFLVKHRMFPWFTALAFIAIPALLIATESARHVVLLVPEWCRIGQTIEWHGKPAGEFILVLGGNGNFADHRFNHGYLNWTDPQCSVISQISLDPISFNGEGTDEEKKSAANPELLRERLSRSRLSDEQLDALTESIWDVLEQARHGKEITSSDGNVDPTWVSPKRCEDEILGFVIWAALFSLLFAITARLTINTS